MNLNYKKENGFTLIELLVVVAIIALLASIVISSLTDSRVKAINAERNQINLQYINALELYRSSNSGYPFYGDADQGDYVCIGYEDSDYCQPDNNSGFPGETDIISALNEYLTGVPPNDQPIISGSDDYSGTRYACSDLGNFCKNYQLRWYLEGNYDCPRGSEKTPTGDYTSCTFNSSSNYQF